MDPHSAACAAARTTADLLPDSDQGPLIQWAASAAVLTCCTDSIDQALALAPTLPTALADSITVVADAYHATVVYNPDDAQAADAADAIARGDLAARWQLGDPTTSEALVVCTVHRAGGAELTVQPYTRTDGAIDWGAAEYTDGSGVVELQGRVADALRAALDSSDLVAARPDAQVRMFDAIAGAMAEAGFLAQVTPR